MSKQLVFNEEARQKILRGVEILSKAVKVTLGPKGRNVIINRKDGAPFLTKDGVTVAREIFLSDVFENVGAQMVKEVASKTNDKAGDGTTTATILAEAIYREGLRSVIAGSSPIYLKRGIDVAVEAIVNKLRKDSQEVSTVDQIRQVATISANWDTEVGDIITDAVERVGKNGVITIEQGGSTKMSLNIVEGMEFNRGYLSPYFCTNVEAMEVVLEDAYIFIHEKRIANLQEILPLMQIVVASKKPLLIISDDIDNEVLSALVINKLRGGFNVCAIKSPGFGDQKKSLLEDTAILTGGKAFTEELGFEPAGIRLVDLGRAKKIIVGKDHTTIIEGLGDAEKIKSRVTQILNLIDKSASDFEKEKLQERLGKLDGGVAVINVGGTTEVEMKEKKDRVEDSLHATRAAVEGGILPGGGSALLRCLDEVKNLNLTGDEKIGAEIVFRAILYPIQTLCANAGVSGDVVISKLLENKEGFGYNVATGVYENLIESGVVDPTKVTVTALQSAASIASLLLTTECIITDAEETVKNTPIGG